MAAGNGLTHTEMSSLFDKQRTEIAKELEEGVLGEILKKVSGDEDGVGGGIAAGIAGAGGKGGDLASRIEAIEQAIEELPEKILELLRQEMKG